MCNVRNGLINNPIPVLSIEEALSVAFLSRSHCLRCTHIFSPCTCWIFVSVAALTTTSHSKWQHKLSSVTQSPKFPFLSTLKISSQVGLIKLTAQHTPYHAYSESGNSLFNTGVSERPNSWISILKNFSVCFSLSCFLVLISCLYVQICPLLLQSFAWEHVYFVKVRDQNVISLLCNADCRKSLAFGFNLKQSYIDKNQDRRIPWIQP